MTTHCTKLEIQFQFKLLQNSLRRACKYDTKVIYRLSHTYVDKGVQEKECLDSPGRWGINFHLQQNWRIYPLKMDEENF